MSIFRHGKAAPACAASRLLAGTAVLHRFTPATVAGQPSKQAPVSKNMLTPATGNTTW
jgi:hypothetical protein